MFFGIRSEEVDHRLERECGQIYSPIKNHPFFQQQPQPQHQSQSYNTHSSQHSQQSQSQMHLKSQPHQIQTQTKTGTSQKLAPHQQQQQQQHHHHHHHQQQQQQHPHPHHQQQMKKETGNYFDSVNFANEQNDAIKISLKKIHKNPKFHIFRCCQLSKKSTVILAAICKFTESY